MTPDDTVQSDTVINGKSRRQTGSSSSSGNSNSGNNSSGGTSNQNFGDSKTITSGFPLNPTGHQKAEIKKTQIVFHYSADSQKTNKGASTIAFLNKTRDGEGLSYHYIIDAAGHVEQLVPDGYKAYHATVANTNAIGISLLNYGYGKDENTSSYGKMGADQTRNVKLVNYEGKVESYRGLTWAQEVTDAQVVALGKLVRQVMTNNPGITYTWNGKSTFNILFPPNTKKGRTTSYKADVPGFYTHNSVTTGKADILPTPKLVNFFKNFKL
jgi:hypothetical protein